MVTYSEDKKTAYFNGLRYTRDDRTGYYLNSTRRERLHRAVYTITNGEIPAGYDVHHIDGDKSNNEPENLQLLERHAHKVRHAEMMTDEHRQSLRANMLNKAIPAAAKWHKSAAGREWHLKHYAEMGALLHQRVITTCVQCGRQFDGQPVSRFCSNRCKSAWRRASGVDNVARVCPVCGETYYANRYAKRVVCSRACSASLHKDRPRNAKAAAAGL